MSFVHPFLSQAGYIPPGPSGILASPECEKTIVRTVYESEKNALCTGFGARNLHLLWTAAGCLENSRQEALAHASACGHGSRHVQHHRLI